MEPISERRISLAGVAGLSTALALFGLRGRQVSLVAKGALLGCGATGVALALFAKREGLAPPQRIRTEEEVRHEIQQQIRGAATAEHLHQLAGEILQTGKNDRRQWIAERIVDEVSNRVSDQVISSGNLDARIKEIETLLKIADLLPRPLSGEEGAFLSSLADLSQGKHGLTNARMKEAYMRLGIPAAGRMALFYQYGTQSHRNSIRKHLIEISRNSRFGECAPMAYRAIEKLLTKSEREALCSTISRELAGDAFRHSIGTLSEIEAIVEKILEIVSKETALPTKLKKKREYFEQIFQMAQSEDWKGLEKVCAKQIAENKRYQPAIALYEGLFLDKSFFKIEAKGQWPAWYAFPLARALDTIGEKTLSSMIRRAAAIQLLTDAELQLDSQPIRTAKYLAEQIKAAPTMIFFGEKRHATTLISKPEGFSTHSLIHYNTGYGHGEWAPARPNTGREMTFQIRKKIPSKLLCNVDLLCAMLLQEALGKDMYLAGWLTDIGEVPPPPEAEEYYERPQYQETCTAQSFMACFRNLVMSRTSGTPQEKLAAYKQFKARFLIELDKQTKDKIPNSVRSAAATSLAKQRAELKMATLAAGRAAFLEIYTKMKEELDRSTFERAIEGAVDSKLGRYATLRRLSKALAAQEGYKAEEGKPAFVLSHAIKKHWDAIDGRRRAKGTRPTNWKKWKKSVKARAYL